jgi:pteridine reductase
MQNEPPVALVTGGARRIGADICRHLHQAGFDIALHYRNSNTAAQHLARELNNGRPNSCRYYASDLDSSRKCSELVKRVIKNFKRLNLLVNNASQFFQTPLESCVETDWDTLLDTNLKAPFFLSQAVLPTLREQGGSIVNIIDAYSRAPQHNYSAYVVSKAGLATLTRNLALELAPEVRVNGVSPGAILWPDADAEALSNSAQENMLARIPLRRKGEPADVSAAVLFLAQAPYITGQVLAVDGGVDLTGSH